MGQVNAPQLQTPMGYDPSSRLWLPLQTSPLQTNPVDGEEYAALAVENDIQTWIRNGQGFNATTGRFATLTNANLNVATCVFNPAASGKSLLVYSGQHNTNQTSSLGGLYLTTVDPAMANVITPVNARPGGAASVASVTSNPNNVTTSQALTGWTALDSFGILAQTPTEVFKNGFVILLPAGSANGVILTNQIGVAGGTFVFTFRWAEF